MSQTPVGGLPQGWENKLADRSSLPPVPGEERGRPHSLFQEHPNPANLHRYHGSKGSSSSRRTTGGTAGLGGSGTGTGGSGGGTLGEGGGRSPPYLRWARNLRDLLEDAEGVRLFQWFVREAGAPHADRLDFYFACQGLKQQKDPQRLKSMVSAIYRFLRKSQLTIPDDVRRKVKLGLKDEEPLEADIFDSMQSEIETIIKETTYLTFLRSDTYLQQAQATQHQHHSMSSNSSTPSSGSISNSSSSKELCASTLAPALATLHEGEELSLSQQHQQFPSSQRLTKDLLMATQKRRLQPETYSGGAHRRNYSVYSHPHLSYSEYCPVSCQDSELQSMSSGRTDSDALSMSGSSVDGMSVGRPGHGARREHSRHLRAIKESATLNRDTHTRDMLLPRTMKHQKAQCAILKPDEFAPLLIEKLEKVKRDRDSQEKLDRKLMENDVDEGLSQPIPPRLFAAAIRDKLQVDDDNDQAILDQHVSRVWSDLTPARSPGGVAPSPPPPPPRPHSHPRRPRDLQSAFSADSGVNVPDFTDTLSSSEGVPSFARQAQARRSQSRKTLTELTDSGVSVVSDIPIHTSSLSAQQPDSRILNWIRDGATSNDKYGRQSFSRSGSTERPGQPVATDPQMPPLPSPHTPTQLDEARRRLLEHHMPPPPIPHPSRHAKRLGQASGKAVAALPPSEIVSTVVVFTFLEEEMPYRTKIPAAPVTLKQFKEYLPKKGNYRYFFKTECEELNNTPIQEEIFNDFDYLPLWEGKVMARVKNIE